VAGIATANANKSTASAEIVYDKSIFDINSIGDEGRYKFSLKEDGDATAMDADGSAGSGSTDAGSAKDTSMIEIDTAPISTDQSVSEEIAPSLDGPSS